jgi:aryl-alcohol dehydrogenase-like predicted oxidoreductase
VPAARELGIGIVAYRPRGQGFLAGGITSREALTGDDDVRRGQQRFAPGNLESNLALLAHVRRLAEELAITPAQLALAWLLAQGDDVVPIPGTKHPDRVSENAAAARVTLTPERAGELERLLSRGAWIGERETFAPYTTTVHDS